MTDINFDPGDRAAIELIERTLLSETRLKGERAGALALQIVAMLKVCPGLEITRVNRRRRSNRKEHRNE